MSLYQQLDSLSIEKLPRISSATHQTSSFDDLWKQTFSDSETGTSSSLTRSTSVADSMGSLSEAPSADLLSSLRSNSSIRSVGSRYSDTNPSMGSLSGAPSAELLSSLRSNSSIQSVGSRYNDINPCDASDCMDSIIFASIDSVELEAPLEMDFPQIPDPPQMQRRVSAPTPVSKDTTKTGRTTITKGRLPEHLPEHESEPKGKSRFSDLKPSSKFHRFRSSSRTSLIADESDNEKGAWRPRRLSARSPSDAAEKSKPWRPRRMSDAKDKASDNRPSRSIMTTYPPRFGTKLRGSKLLPSTRQRRSGSVSGAYEAGPARGGHQDNRFKRHVVEVTGDPDGVANGKYFYTEKYCRKPYFTRHKPFKGTLAPKTSHGMWFLLAWGKDGAWKDYCATSVSELPPADGWRKCQRNKNKKGWIFGDDVPSIKVEVLKDAYPTYT